MRVSPKGLAIVRALMLCALAIIGFSGCATHSIWEGPLLDNFHEPARPSRLTVYTAPAKQDYLVQYDDLSPSKDWAVPKAYYLEENRAQTVRARKPHFVNLKTVSKGVPVPVFNATNLSSYVDVPLYVVQENHQRFRLYGPGNNLIGEYDLPTYPSNAGTVKRVLLTPITLTLDATVIGGYVFYYCAPEILGTIAASR